MVPYQIPGVCLVVSRSNQILINKAFGFANVKSNIKASTQNYHRIASISKTFT